MDNLEGDPAIEMLKDVVRSEVETLKENFMEEVLGPFRIALKEKLKSIKKEILTSVESTVQANKNDIMKQVDERLKQTLANHAKETDQIKGTSAKKDEESDETDSSDDENLSDIEEKLWGKSYTTSKGSKRKNVNDNDETEENEADAC